MAPYRIQKIMKPTRIALEDVASWDNLTRALERAARGKRYRPEVMAFLARADAHLAELQSQMLDGTVPLGRMTRFRIRDPKPRVIHAPSFPERVLHHAIVAHVGPVLDRALVDDTFACRTGKGTLAAVQRCQQHVRRFPWYAKLDIRQYFASVDHAVLKAQLRRRLKPGLGRDTCNFRSQRRSSENLSFYGQILRTSKSFKINSLMARFG